MYEHFTDQARKVMRLANQEAMRFNHEYIGTEHQLLGLVKEDSGVGARVLKNLGIDLRKIRLEVEKIVAAGPDMVTMGKLPLTPRAKKVIEYAQEEAKHLSHNYVGTEHLLLGLVRETEGLAAQIIMNLGFRLEVVRQEVFNLLGVSSEEIKKEIVQVVSDLPASAHHVFQALNEQISCLTAEKENAVADMDFDKAAACRDQADKLIKVREFLFNLWRE